MKNGNRRWALLLGIALLACYLLAAMLADAGPDRNRRLDTLTWPAFLVATTTGTAVAAGRALTIAPLPSSGASTATWTLDSYEITHLLGQARDCRATAFVLDTALTSATPGGIAEILFDGTVVERIHFSQARAGFFATAPGRFVPDVTPQTVDVVPLDRRFGFTVPLPARFCRARDWTIEVRGVDVSWAIAYVGIVLDYTPERVPLVHSVPLTVFFGASLAAALIALLFLLLLRFSTLGRLPSLVATGVLALAPLTFDQWDFPLWIRFSEVATFGGGNPAYLWSASPLWAFVPSLFSTIALASYLIAGDGSRSLTELFLKIGLGLAYCWNAYAIAVRAPIRLRRFVAVAALLVPGGLYELTGGYREPFAGALALLGLALAQRRRLLLATVVFWAAASISETLLPMLLFPAALRLASADAAQTRLRASVALGALGIGLFGVEWIVAVPHAVASQALGYRFGSAALGTASWSGALEGLGRLPSWLPVRSLWFGVGVLAGASVFPALRYVAILQRSHARERAAFADVFGVFVAFVAAFFLAFRGVDPNTWYTLLVLTSAYFALVDATNPFPLLFGTVLGLSFYGIAGLREFVNRELFWPVDRGLLGILGTSRHVFDLMLAALAVCLIVAISSGRPRALFSRQSPWFAGLFFSAVAATSIASPALDVVVGAAVAALLVSILGRQMAARRHRPPGIAAPPQRALGLAAIAGSGAVCAGGSATAGVAGFAALGMALTYGLGTCDVVLSAGAVGVLAVQAGTGWASIAGWLAFAATVVFALVRSARAAPVFSATLQKVRTSDRTESE